MADLLRTIDNVEYYRTFIAKQLRPDGRTFLQRRNITIQPGSVSTANGSCLTKIGSTSVLAAIKLEVSPPLNATPTQGFLEVSVQLTPLCSPLFKIGKPSDAAFSLQQHLQRILSTYLNLDELCISEGKAVSCVNLFFCLCFHLLYSHSLSSSALTLHTGMEFETRCALFKS